MKKIYILSLITISFMTSSNAYEFSFFNNTNTPVGIAIQYTSNDGVEPLYRQLAKPQSMIIFTPGKMKIPEIKWGFCLDNIYYVQNPTTEQKVRNFEKAPWRKIAITWTEEKSITKRKEKKQISRKSNNIPAPATPVAPVQKSLCKDRHFDIIADEQGKISITSSLNE